MYGQHDHAPEESSTRAQHPACMIPVSKLKLEGSHHNPNISGDFIGHNSHGALTARGKSEETKTTNTTVEEQEIMYKKDLLSLIGQLQPKLLT